MITNKMQSEAPPLPQSTIDDNTAAIQNLQSYIHGQIIRRIIISMLIAIVGVFFANYTLRQLLFWNDIQGSMNPVLFITTLVAVAIPLAATTSLVVNLINIRTIHQSYQSFNKHFYKPLFKFLGYFNAVIAALSFLRFLNPGGWLLQIERKPEFLLDTLLHGASSYASFGEANRAEIMQQVLARYFELRAIHYV
ncbi:hypothetical protein EOL96_03600 [Candidatus Saccharibacteria bacterium]|nr:hypothetical protein [Candidatus Saccharibacteria bacterium]